jgi:hypothetical protein
MGFSVSCHSCGHTFPEMDDSLRGQQARCPCGEIVTLSVANDDQIAEPEVPSLLASVPSSKAPRSHQSDSDSNRSGQRRQHQGKGSQPVARSQKQSQPRQTRPAQGAQQSSRGRKTAKRRTLPTPVSTPPKSRLKSHPTPHTDAKPKPDEAPLHPASVHTDPPTQAKSHPVETTHATKVTHAASEQAPLIGDTFSDLDAILEAGADHRPLGPQPNRPSRAAQPTRSQSRPQRRPLSSQRVANPVRRPDRSHSPPSIPADAVPQESQSIGPLLGTIGALVAFVSALLIASLTLAARFSVLAETPFEWFALPLNGLYLGFFNSGAVEGTNRTLMVAAGWCLTVVMGLMLAAAFLLFVRIAVYLLAGVQILGWSRWIVFGLAATGVLLGTAWWFTYASYENRLMQRLRNDDPAAFGILEEPESKKQLRRDYADESKSVSTALIVLGSSLVLTLAGASVALGLEQRTERAIVDGRRVAQSNG